MECRATLCLTSSEISRARSFGGEVKVDEQQEVNSWICDVNFESVTKALSFLRTIRDLQGYNDGELEEGYIRKVR